MGTIFIPAGHHLGDPGAGAYGRQENLLTIEFRNRVAHEIHKQNPDIKVWMDNDYHTLPQVIGQVRELATPKDILMEPHFNAAGKETVQGTESFVARNARKKSIQLATECTEIIAKMMKTPNRGVKYDYESQHNRLGILYTPASSFLPEIDFITNNKAMQAYEEILDRLPIAIANKLIQYVTF